MLSVLPTPPQDYTLYFWDDKIENGIYGVDNIEELWPDLGMKLFSF